MKQYYDILGISQNASEDEIKKAYKKKVFATHPDRNNGNDEEFKKVAEAYEILIGKRNTTQQENSSNFHDFGINPDIFNNIFEQIRNQQSVPHFQQKPPENDSDISLEFNLTLDDVKKGRIIPFGVTKSKQCDKCNGQGGEKKEICNDCNGKGIVENVQIINNMRIGYTNNCLTCHTQGQKIINPCKKCNSLGYIIFRENFNIQIKKI